jgi:predicted O-methyltransferase YrrM
MPVVSESTWTKARPDCPHPEWWSSTDPQSTELEVSELVAAFVRALQPEYVLETGTCIGQTAEIIGRALEANGHGRLETLETDPERAAFSRQRCDGLPVSVLETPSLEFAPPSPIDFAWLDSRTELRVAEFERFKPHLSPWAVVGFHDTSPHQGVWGRAVESLPGTRAIRLRTPRGVTFVEPFPNA